MPLEDILAVVSAAPMPASWRKALAYKAVEMASHPPASSEPRGDAFASFEKVLSCGRHYGHDNVLALVGALNQSGATALAKRVRSLARIRGAHAHPYPQLAEEVEAALRRPPAQHEGAHDWARRTAWSPDKLCDSRRLRGTGVQPTRAGHAGAEPELTTHAHADVGDERIESLELQVALLATSLADMQAFYVEQFERRTMMFIDQVDSLKPLPRAPADLMSDMRALQDRMTEFEDKSVMAEESLDDCVRRMHRRVACAETIAKEIDDEMAEVTDHLNTITDNISTRVEALCMLAEDCRGAQSPPPDQGSVRAPEQPRGLVADRVRSFEQHRASGATEPTPPPARTAEASHQHADDAHMVHDILAAVQSLGDTLGRRIEVIEADIIGLRRRTESIPYGLAARLEAAEARLTSAPTSSAIAKLHDKVERLAETTRLELDALRVETSLDYSDRADRDAAAGVQAAREAIAAHPRVRAMSARFGGDLVVDHVADVIAGGVEDVDSAITLAAQQIEQVFSLAHNSAAGS